VFLISSALRCGLVCGLVLCPERYLIPRFRFVNFARSDLWFILFRGFILSAANFFATTRPC
jgi:hypothetical protein